MRILTRAALILLPLGTLAAAVREPRAPREITLLVAATTDVHGHLTGWDYYANRPDSAHGLARAATIVDSLRATAPGRVVLVDAGDMLQGTPLTYVAARRKPFAVHPVFAAMNVMHYDAAAVGNHEFNYGLPFLYASAMGAHFPLLAANAYAANGPAPFPGRTVIERDGVRIALIGATTPGSNAWDKDNLAGRLRIGAIVPAVRAQVDSAHREHADVVVVVMHTGLGEPSSYDTVAARLPSENVAAVVAHEVPGIDLIVYGHSHKQMADTVIAGVLLMQPRNWAQSVAVASLHLEQAAGVWRVAGKSSSLIQSAGHGQSKAVLEASRDAHESARRYVAMSIGSSSVVWSADSGRVADTPLADFILEVERRTAHSDLASTAVFDVGARIDPGPVTVGEIARLYPYENTLSAVRITGAQLRAYLEYSARYYGTYGSGEPAVHAEVPGYNFDIVAGADYTIDLARPTGQRITSLTVQGAPVRDTDSFTLALNNYRRSGGGGYAMLRDAPEVYNGTTEIRDLLIAEVERRKHIAPADYFQRNWSIVPEAAIAAAYKATHSWKQ
ncbi:MAG: 5'-nucleotidase C-terminal domain-containing protein [Gemmatimonadaceae bacterium]|nr:5'-nucleotidase C-terminal domain-containing protein [Gemmatimonadaceae bacterium]